ncbi:hypothetical protein LJ707_06990 [Mucilaginibacter sp. UR6-1]|uniref:hypothetical protein n=1 Tax=Mucilaginibacter sp. UR6-1 TaxID=1435643 RepID=UPI001E64F4D8|nr:hypothetical protein [Mucilaginibacter sp. UR6-1]MCC8408668.1 hypothetical protein [Mucilaginibacter sp. UR6-1]
MKAKLYHRAIYLRIATGMLFVLLIGFKTVLPVFIASMYADKEFATNADEDGGEKKAESAFPHEKEFTRPSNYISNNVFWDSYIEHCTIYKGSYQSSYYQKITIPPPDSAPHYC